MRDKDLLAQLNKLSEIKPRAEWKDSQREILHSQIVGQTVVSEKFSFREAISLPLQVVKSLPQPAMAFFIMAFLGFTGYLGVSASRDTVPGETLYMAKIASEKTQKVLTFDTKKKAKLGIEIATNRAVEINQVIQGADTQEEKEQNIVKLASIFRKEISDARERIEQIDHDNTGESNVAPVVLDNSEEAAQPAADVETPAVSEESPEDPLVFTANSGKDERGIQISKPESQNENVATGTEDTNKAEIVFGTTQSILNEARELFEAEDYSGTLTKLDEANNALTEAINAAQDGDATTTPESETGEVLSAEEEATTTPDSEN